ncbi:tol-pal system protein YbgF [Frateuria edaphi]|uniref:tol-pal system protein YbgF n=1 Tax=Frateuria edaphi TaxID=2898793 RepID=UPI001E6149D1|nr:tol-pal system protein YbgF [Frateuria edaphi]UGB46217.1 tol-pal system protein YbgF [Frateuria edaphi]
MKSALAKRFSARLGMAGAFASAMLIAVPALAQDSRLSLADRVSRLEQQAQAQNQGGTSLVNQVQQLQSQVQQLQGLVEELQHTVQQLEEKNKAQYIDLDSRLGRLEGNGAGTNSTAAGNTPASTASAAAAATPANPAQAPAVAPADGSSAPAAAPDANAQAAYDTAFQALRGGDYAQASRGFRSFIQQYPDNSLTPNAWYWLGESYYVTMNYPVALEAFQRLLSQFPQSEKAPDALLKVGYSQLELKQADAGKATLQQVTSKYPNSRAASLAQERLRRLQLQSAIR